MTDAPQRKLPISAALALTDADQDPLMEFIQNRFYEAGMAAQDLTAMRAAQAGREALHGLRLLLGFARSSESRVQILYAWNQAVAVAAYWRDHPDFRRDAWLPIEEPSFPDLTV